MDFSLFSGASLMKPGDVLFVKSGSNVIPGSRYSCGMIVEKSDRWEENSFRVRWIDGFIAPFEKESRLQKWYDVVTNENR